MGSECLCFLGCAGFVPVVPAGSNGGTADLRKPAPKEYQRWSCKNRLAMCVGTKGIGKAWNSCRKGRSETAPDFCICGRDPPTVCDGRACLGHVFLVCDGRSGLHRSVPELCFLEWVVESSPRAAAVDPIYT